MSGARATPPQRVPTLTEVVEFDLPPVAGAAQAGESLQARIVANLQRRIEDDFDRRLHQALAPALARAVDALVRDLRGELALALEAQVASAVAQEFAHSADPAGRDSGATPD